MARATEIVRSDHGLVRGTIAALIVAYKQSPKYLTKAPRTRELYLGYLDQIQTEFGDLQAAGFRPNFVTKIQQRHAAHPRKANMLIVMLRILMGLAVKDGIIPSNPISRPDMLPTPPRTQLWSREDEQAFLEVAPRDLHLGFMLMLYTTQRLSDVLAMTKGQVYEQDGRLMIELRQQKTETLIAVPVHRDLEALLRQRLADPAGGLLLVPSPTGLHWSRRNFSRKWDLAMHRLALHRADALVRRGWSQDKVSDALEQDHRQRRDLRRTGVVRMAEVGVTTPQIAAISGHKIDACQKIIDTYLPRRTEVGLAAIEAWERGEAAAASRARVVRLADHARQASRTDRGKAK
jgi:integrase